MNEGWKCPNCGSAHAPDVKTCPGAPPVFIPSVWTSPPILPDCGCPLGNYTCMNVACPRRAQVTVTTIGLSDNG